MSNAQGANGGSAMPGDRSARDGDTPVDVDRLIGRLVDGEARADDRARFDTLASGDPLLWKRLAEQQSAMSELESQLACVLEVADRVELPRESSARRMPAAPSRPSLWMVGAAVGWAAVLFLAIAWFVSGRSEMGPRGEPVRDDLPIRHDAHMDVYLTAPWIVGEAEPVVMQVETLDDGRIRVRYIRRIEEYVILQDGEEVPVDEATGHLTVQPVSLHRSFDGE